MRTFPVLAVGVLIGTIASGGVFASLQEDMTTNVRTPSTYDLQRVDRTHKGNRLNPRTGESTKIPTRSPVRVPEKILIGCEPLASFSSAAADQAGRCAT